MYKRFSKVEKKIKSLNYHIYPFSYYQRTPQIRKIFIQGTSFTILKGYNEFKCEMKLKEGIKNMKI